MFAIHHPRFATALILVASLSLIAYGCGSNATEKPKNREEVIAVRLAPVSSRIVNKTILASGMVSSNTEARLAFKTGGVINRLYVDEGQSIYRGQLLATLNLTEISAQVAQAREGLAKAERDLNRVRNLYADSVATKEQLQNATTAYNVAKQSATIAGFNESYSEIRSPLTGKVLKKYLNEGEIVASGNPVFLVAATTAGDWVVKVGLADREWARLQLGDKASITLDAYPEKILTGTVRQLAETADPQTSTFEVEIAIAPTEGVKLASGLLASVEITPQQQAKQTLVPLAALVESNGKQGFVYTVDAKGIARRREVRIAFLTADEAVISHGLEGVSEVVTAGSPYLSDGQAVAVKK